MLTTSFLNGNGHGKKDSLTKPFAPGSIFDNEPGSICEIEQAKSGDRFPFQSSNSKGGGVGEGRRLTLL